MALKLKSNNSQGNPYHDEEGKFTSKGGEGTGGSEKSSDPLMDLFGSLGKSMRDSEAEEKEAMKMFGLKDNEEKSAENKVEEISEEEKQASKLFGTDLSDKKTWEIDETDPEMANFLKLDYKGRQQAKKEGRLPKQFEKLDQKTISSLMAGYDESVMDAPSSVKVWWRKDGEETTDQEVTADDLVEFVKFYNDGISPEDEQLIRDNYVIPKRLLTKIRKNKKDYSEDDLYDDLSDFM